MVAAAVWVACSPEFHRRTHAHGEWAGPVASPLPVTRQWPVASAIRRRHRPLTVVYTWYIRYRMYQVYTTRTARLPGRMRPAPPPTGHLPSATTPAGRDVPH
ncbi:hypothetical protein Kisp02_12770 [Kineosporia sp. NBRC 101731]|nr:hypothetical protein Kisp02_12770 [Kineosporia sp. NBRC 101731]